MLEAVKQQHQFSLSVKPVTKHLETTKPQRGDRESQVLVVDTETSSSSSQETLQIATSDSRCKEKIALKLNSLNDKKARYESHKTFLSKCHRDKIIPHGFMWNLQLVTKMKHFLKPGTNTSNRFP